VETMGLGAMGGLTAFDRLAGMKEHEPPAGAAAVHADEESPDDD